MDRLPVSVKHRSKHNNHLSGPEIVIFVQELFEIDLSKGYPLGPCPFNQRNT